MLFLKLLLFFHLTVTYQKHFPMATTSYLIAAVHTKLFPSFSCLKIHFSGFPGGAVVESLPANAGDTGSSPGLGGSHMPQSN